MARVVITGDLARRFIGNEISLQIEADNVRGLIRALDEKYPGLGEELSDPSMAVALDGDILPDALLEPVSEDTEVHFLPAIRGG